jgi:hypothetical protein
MFFLPKSFEWHAIHSSIASFLAVTAVPVTAVVEVDVFCCLNVTVTTIAVTTAANTSDPRTTSVLILLSDQ